MLREHRGAAAAERRSRPAQAESRAAGHVIGRWRKVQARPGIRSPDSASTPPWALFPVLLGARPRVSLWLNATRFAGAAPGARAVPTVMDGGACGAMKQRPHGDEAGLSQVGAAGLQR